jgi:hypothetical protein
MMGETWGKDGGKFFISTVSVSQLGFICNLLAFLLFQGKLDALWVLLRKGYDRVSVMRPQPGDTVGFANGHILRHTNTDTHTYTLLLF